MQSSIKPSLILLHLRHATRPRPGPDPVGTPAPRYPGSPVPRSCPDTFCSSERVFPQPVKPVPFKLTHYPTTVLPVTREYAENG